jgi:hypothetical protein
MSGASNQTGATVVWMYQWVKSEAQDNASVIRDIDVQV